MFENAVIIDLVFRKHGIRRQADIGLVDTEADRSMLTLTKAILDSAEYRRIMAAAAYCRRKIRAILYGSVSKKVPLPNVFKSGAYLVPIKLLDSVVSVINEFKKQYEEAVEVFLEAYPQRIEEAKERLRDYFNPKDYPPVERLRASFGVRYSIIRIDVPSRGVIGDALYEEQRKVAANEVGVIAEEVKLALRESFRYLTETLVEKLRPSEDGKKKVLRQENLQAVLDFIDKFSQRDIANDRQMQIIVDEARRVLAGVDIEAIRKQTPIRQYVEEKMVEVKDALDMVIEEMPIRKFSFDTEEA